MNLFKKNSHVTLLNLNLFNVAQRKQAHLAGLFAICVFLDEKKQLNGKNMGSVSALQRRFPGIATDDAKRVLHLCESRYDSIQKLTQRFSSLNSMDAEALLEVFKELHIGLFPHPKTNALILAARGTASRKDIQQNVMTALGAKGEKYQSLQQLVPLLKKHQIYADIYTGTSLGGGIVMALANMLDATEAVVITFDAQRLNRRQYHFSQSHQNVQAVPCIDYRIASVLSLGAIMSNPLFKQVKTLAIPKHADTYNPLKQLKINHSPGEITRYLK
ncbi:MAG: hypothetical protein AAGB12_01025 [Pseudomonadota bacterium]